MKKLIAMMLSMMIASTVNARDYEPMPEHPLPPIYTRQDMEKVILVRRVALVTGVASILGAVWLEKHSRTLRRRHDAIDATDYNNVIMMPGGGTRFGQDAGRMERKGYLSSKARSYRSAAGIAGLLGIAGLSIAFTLRF